MNIHEGRVNGVISLSIHPQRIVSQRNKKTILGHSFNLGYRVCGHKLGAIWKVKGLNSFSTSVFC